MDAWYTAAELAGLPGLPGTVFRVRERAEREGWASRKRAKGKGLEYPFSALPPATQAALLLRAKPASAAIFEALAEAGIETGDKVPPSEAEIADRSARYARLPANYRQTAERRLQALLAVEALRREGRTEAAARQLVAARMKAEGADCTVTTLWRWASDVARVPRPYWLFFLAPRWAGRTTTAECAPEVWDAFKADFLRLEAPAASACYARVKRLADKHGWAMPSLKTLLRRLEREIPPPVLVLAREGVEAMMRMYPAQQREHDVFHALEAVNADGHKVDVFVRHPLGHVCRPILVAFHDIYSAKVLAWRWAETESADAVRLALSDLVRTYGIPTHAWLDNGRAFASKFITGGTRTRYRFKVKPEDPTGIAVALGIEIHWATPYHGQAKPIERAFRDLCETLAKAPAFAGAYVGNNPMAKPENYGSKAVPWEEFVAVADAEIAAHNARSGRRSKVCAGRSFDEVFAASYAAHPVRRATADQLRDLLLASDAVTVSSQDGAIHYAGNRYWTESLSRHAGERVMLRFDPDRLHAPVHVYGLDGSYIAEAECRAPVGFADQAAATEHARAKSQYKRANKQALAAQRRMDVAQLADQLAGVAPPAADAPKATVVAPKFGQGKGRKVLADGSVVDLATGEILQPAPSSGELTEREKQYGEFMERHLAAMRKRG